MANATSRTLYGSRLELKWRDATVTHKANFTRLVSTSVIDRREEHNAGFAR